VADPPKTPANNKKQIEKKLRIIMFMFKKVIKYGDVTPY
jgi:hypothetical protein